MECIIYDPRNGGSRTFAIDDTRISSLEQNVWIAEVSGSDWGTSVDLVDRLFAQHPGADKYVTFLPWAPRVESRAEVFGRVFPSRHDTVTGPILLGSDVSRGHKLVERVLALRAELGAGGSGLWSVGAVDDMARIEDLLRQGEITVDSPILLAAAVLQHIRVALALDDGVDMLFVRLTSAVTPLVDAIQQHLTASNTA